MRLGTSEYLKTACKMYIFHMFYTMCGIRNVLPMTNAFRNEPMNAPGFKEKCINIYILLS